MTREELAKKTLSKELSIIKQSEYMRDEGYYVNDSDADSFILTNVIWRACVDFDVNDKALYNFTVMLNRI